MAKRSSDRVEIPSGEDQDANIGDNDTPEVAEALGESLNTEFGGDSGGNGDGEADLPGQGDQQRQYYDPAEYILDEAGNPTFPPPGRIRKYRRRGGDGSAAPQSGARPTGKKVPVKYTQEDIDTNA